MKFLRPCYVAVAVVAVLVVKPAYAQDDALPEPDSTTEIAQNAPADTIDLDDPDASSRLSVPANDQPPPRTSAPAPSSSKAGPRAPTNPGASATANREANQRQSQAVSARKAISEADVLRSNGQLEAASERLEFALNNLYSTGASAADFQRASYGLAAVRSEQAQLEFKEGNWGEAVSLYEKAVALDPANQTYRQGLASARERQEEAIAAGQRVDEESTSNPAITPEFIERVKIVRRLFYEYERFEDTGQYDKAADRLKRILALDPYNRAARQLQRKLEKKKYKAATEFRKMTREKALLDVTEKWYERVPPSYGVEEDEQERKEADISRLAQMETKLRQITVPSINFESLDIEQVVQFLEQKAFELDETGIDPRGVNFVLNLNSGAEGEDAPNITRRVSLSLSNVPLSEVLRFVSTITNLQVKVEEYAVVLAPTGSTQFLDTRTFSAPPGFIPADVASAGTDDAGFSNVEGVTVDVKEVLSSKGVSFDAPGSTAIFLGNVNKLIVKNTPAELDIIDALIRSGAATEQPQVEIETKFAEFTDDSLKALYFQYYYSATADIAATTPALAPYNFFPGNLPLNSSVKSAGQSALRTAEISGQGTGASAFAGITADGVDQLLRLNAPGTGFTPTNFLTGGALGVNDFNTLAVGAVINGRGFAAVVQAIDNVQGVDLLASPKVTTKNRTPATIEIVRELRYPTEFERPEINPEVFTINEGLLDVNFGTGENVFIVLPSTPREFEIRNIGVTLNVTPTTYPDQRIDLELEPEVVDFEGFIDYGGDITQVLYTVNGIDIGTGLPTNFALGRQVIADGIVNQPIFSVRSIKTKMQVLDGQTIMMGGLIREDRQEINDKVPFFGDVPLVGRLFTSKVEQSVKRNLTMFVTARLIKSDGTPLYSGLLPDEQIDKLEISPDLTPMIAPPPPPRYIRVRREDPKQMYDGKMLIDSKAMFEPDTSKEMFEVATDEKTMSTGGTTIEFEDDTTIYSGDGDTTP